MTKNEVMAQLKKMGSEEIRNVYRSHGATEDFYGVRIGDMKKTIVKQVKKDYQLAKDLFDTGIGDAMYLAGLIADEKKMTKADLEHWAKTARWMWISEFTVAWVASETPYGWELGLKWIDAKKENLATSGWGTLSSIASTTPNDQLDIKTYEKLIDRIVKEIHRSPNRVRYAMNSFLITVGGAIPELTDKAMAAAKAIGKVEVDMGDTSCKVPAAAEYILKIKKAGKLGNKRKSARC